MSSNDQVIVAPFPEDLDKYAVWHDGCVDNPFDFSRAPSGIFDTLEEAVSKADDMCGRTYGYPVEYGVRIILRSKISGYDSEFGSTTPIMKVPSSERR